LIEEEVVLEHSIGISFVTTWASHRCCSVFGFWNKKLKETFVFGMSKLYYGNRCHIIIGFISLDGWMDFGGWSPARLLHAGLNSGLMCIISLLEEVHRKLF
jgi:hypothetical protein